MGRLELPRIAPYAPQAHVSTNSTTSALNFIFYFAGLGSEDAGWLCSTCSGITEFISFLDERVANAREVHMNITAATVVNLLKILPAPALPNIAWLPCPPKAEPIAAPLPVCKRTIKTKNKAAIM
jgi:hypothetical protein